MRPGLKELLFKEDPGDVGCGSSVDQISKCTAHWDLEIFDLLDEFGVGFRSPLRITELDLFELCDGSNLRDNHPADAVLGHVELGPLISPK